MPESRLTIGCSGQSAGGAPLDLMVGIFDSLWPAIVLHVLVDLGSGIIAWLTLREEQVTDAA